MWGKSGLKVVVNTTRKKLVVFLEILNRHILIMASKK